MAKFHTVEQGEHLSGIALKYGFRHYSTLWEHPQNKDLREKRQNPHVLFPGDQLFIPDKQTKKESRQTGQRHRFKVAGAPLKLRIVVRDFDNQPVMDTECQLEVEGVTHQVRTDGQGLFEKEVPRTAVRGRLCVPALGIEMPLLIGHLDPADENSGWEARLVNLGYHPNLVASEDESQLVHAIEEFQCDHKLKITGLLDDTTKAKIKELHGC